LVARTEVRDGRDGRRRGRVRSGRKDKPGAGGGLEEDWDRASRSVVRADPELDFACRFEYPLASLRTSLVDVPSFSSEVLPRS